MMLRQKYVCWGVDLHDYFEIVQQRKKYWWIKYGKIFLIVEDRQWEYQFIALLFANLEFIIMWNLKNNAELLNHINLENIGNTEASNEVE